MIKTERFINTLAVAITRGIYMPAQLTQVSGKEFVGKILQGERDFSGISLEPQFDLGHYEGFEEMQAYLKKQDLRKNPVIIDNSEFYPGELS